MTNPSAPNRDEPMLKAMHEAGSVNGVAVRPTPITAGQEITMLYKGLLAGEEKDHVYVHLGYGKAGNWRNISHMPMERTGWGWVRTMRVPDTEDRLNFCFQDGRGNWDNNSGLNWSFEIHGGNRF